MRARAVRDQNMMVSLQTGGGEMQAYRIHIRLHEITSGHYHVVVRRRPLHRLRSPQLLTSDRCSVLDRVGRTTVDSKG